jgi:hypothetical protein
VNGHAIVTGPLIGDDDLLSALRAVPGAVHRSYVVPEHRIMFNALNKNACTSLKWMIAAIAGEDLSRFSSGLTTLPTNAEAVHNRWQWKVSPTLDKLDPEIRAGIHPDNGWFIFAVVRDPRTRLFSAWQNKLLTANPGYARWAKEDWYPRQPADVDTMVADFTRFVDFLEREPQHELRLDPHFRDQADLLVPSAVQYSQVYDISEMRQLRADLEVHLAATGWSGELYVPRSNTSPLWPNGRLFVDGVREQVERIYAADFELFGDRWDFASIDTAPEWSTAECRQIDMLVEHGQRIGELRDIGITYRDRAQALDDDLQRLGKHVNSLEAAAAAPLRSALRRRARSVVRQAGRRRNSAARQ